MAAKRLPTREHWPKWLYQIRGDYFIYRSAISGRSMSLGKIPEKEAVAYGVWANKQVDEVRIEELVGRVSKPHAFIDSRGLLEADFIAEKAMSFDRICGVYFLLLGPEIVYVGQSRSIMTRLANHKFQATKQFDRVFVIECPEAHLNRMERLYIDKFKPKHNGTEPLVDQTEKVWSENIRGLLGTGIHQAI